MTYPKECINSKCNTIVFIEYSQLHLPLQCEKCINKKNNDKSRNSSR